MLWRKITQSEWSYQVEAKAAHTMDKIGRKLFLFGGWNGRTALNTLEIFDLDKEEWNLLETSGERPSPRNNHASCVVNEFIYIHGGHDGDNWLGDFFVLDTKKLEWNGINCSQYTPKSRACHTLSRIGRKIYMFGGYDGKESFSHVEVFDIQTQLWTCLNFNTSNDSIIRPRNAHSATVYNKKIYIYGGHCKNLHLNDLIVYDPLKNQWSVPKLQGTVPQGIRGHSANVILNKIYLFGGYDGKNRSNDVFRFTLDDFTFTKVNSNKENVLPRQRHTGTVNDTFKILFFGGFDGAKWLSSFDELNLAVLESNISLENCHNNLKQNFRELLNNEEYSDLIFSIDDKKIFAHKSILFVRCEYFKNMFSDYMMERNSDIIHINSFNYDVFVLFLEFVYTSSVSFRDTESIFKLYELADAYSFESLKKYCEDFLNFSLEIDNVVELLILGYKCSSATLENSALDYISRNRQEVYQFGHLYKLIEFPSLMVKILTFL